MTPRQQEARDLRDQGFTLRQIAKKMGISFQRVGQLLNPHRVANNQRILEVKRDGIDITQDVENRIRSLRYSHIPISNPYDNE